MVFNCDFVTCYIWSFNPTVGIGKFIVATSFPGRAATKADCVPAGDLGTLLVRLVSVTSGQEMMRRRSAYGPSQYAPRNICDGD